MTGDTLVVPSQQLWVAQVKADFDAADKAQAASAGFQPVTFSQLPA